MFDFETSLSDYTREEDVKKVSQEAGQWETLQVTQDHDSRAGTGGYRFKSRRGLLYCKHGLYLKQATKNKVISCRDHFL